MNHSGEMRHRFVVVFVDELMSATRIEAVLAHLGYQSKTVGQASALLPVSGSGAPQRPGEPIDGPLAELMNLMTAWQPVLVIFDLANTSIPWREWLAVLKSSPSTRRLPVICYGPHVDKAALSEAKDLVAEPDVVVPRSKFFSAMPQLVTATAREFDFSAIRKDCLRPPSHMALRGLEEFNNAHYFEAHEHLEDAWNADDGAARELYRAVLQVAVAYLQIERRNYRGAVKMFLRARQWLAPLPDTCHGIDVARLRLDSEHVHGSLAELGPDAIEHFDLSSLPPVHYTAAHAGTDGLSESPSPELR